METKIRILIVKWTVSRGYETYGYNICTLRENGIRKAVTKGGGYDMLGTVFGEWLQNEYQSEMMKIADRFTRLERESKDEPYTQTKPAREKHLYGGFFYAPASGSYALDGGGHVSLDGACGISSMNRIAEAIGLQVVWRDGGKRDDVIVVTEMEQ